eukprot:scaffold7634_cov51-Prasinocladus_malaysianus.AAC.2
MQGSRSTYWAGTAVPIETALGFFQLVGYAISKMLAVKIVPESIQHRVSVFLVLILACLELSMLLLAIIPLDYKILATFLAGLPAGLVWGFIVSYLEGRRTSDVMLVSLSISYIVSNSPIDAIGNALIGAGMQPIWVPAAIGALTAPIFLLCVWLLHQLPPPSNEDVAERLERTAMNHSQRLVFTQSWGLGLLAILGAQLMLVTYKEVRATAKLMIMTTPVNYGLDADSMAFLDLLVGLSVLIPISALVFVRSNAAATFASFCWMAAGSATLMVACIILSTYTDMNAKIYYALTGIGCMMGYVPFSSTLFERMLPYTGERGTITFPMALADAISYTAVVGVYVAQIYHLHIHNSVIPGSTDALLQAEKGILVYQVLGYFCAFVTVILYAAAVFYFFVMFPRFKRENASGQVVGVDGRGAGAGAGRQGGTPTIAIQAEKPGGGSGSAGRKADGQCRLES